MTPQEAAIVVSQSLAKASGLDADPATEAFLVGWFGRPNRDGESRAELIKADPGLVADLCGKVEELAGEALRALVALTDACSASGCASVTVPVVRGIIPAMSTAATRLCDDDPPPDGG